MVENLTKIEPDQSMNGKEILQNEKAETAKEPIAPMEKITEENLIPLAFDPFGNVSGVTALAANIFNPCSSAGIPLTQNPFNNKLGSLSSQFTIPDVTHTPILPLKPMMKGVNPVPTNEPKLENIVSTVNFDCKLELRKIALQAKNAEYNPKRFAAVIMRIRDPKTTALIFHSGKMVCTGAKTEADSETAARKYAKTIKKLGFDVKFKEFTIQNIVGSSSVNFLINLEALKVIHQKFCTYDPEIFPGLIYRMEQPHVVLLIFCSGKVVLTGAKKREQLTEAFKKILPTLKKCQKKENSGVAKPIA